MSTDAELGLILGTASAVLVVYAVPTIVAFYRGHPNRWPILIVNIAFGATFVGWLAALIWAAHAVHRPIDRLASRGGESGLDLMANDRSLLAANVVHHNNSEISITEAIERLKRLDVLRSSKAITQAEFDMLKSGVLNAKL